MSLADERSGVRRLRATAHPLRLEMLSLLTGAALSAAEVARELGVTQANASYHLRLLHRAGLVEEAGQEKVNGAWPSGTAPSGTGRSRATRCTATRTPTPRSGP